MTYQNKSYLGSGDLFMQAYDGSGNLTGTKVQVGNTDNFAINAPTIEKAERKGKMRENWGKTIHSQVKSVEQEMSFTLTDIDRHNLSIAMFGTDVTHDQTAGNDASPQDIVAALAGWVDLGHMKLDPDTPPVVQDETDTTTYVEGTDYEIDYQAGWLMALEGGSITEGETLHVTTTWLAYTGYKITGHTVTQKEYKLELLTKNQAGDNEGILTVHKAQLEPSGDMAWLSEEYIDLEMSGKIITVAAGTWDLVQYE